MKGLAARIQEEEKQGQNGDRGIGDRAWGQKAVELLEQD